MSLFKSRYSSFRYAFRGIGLLLRQEVNARIHLVIAIAVVATGILLQISTLEWIAVVFCIGFVLAAEGFNTAIEKLTDTFSPGFHEMAGKVKDLAAGAVLLAAITSIVIGILIFLPKIIHLLS